MQKFALTLIALLGLSASASAGPVYVNLAQGELATVDPATGTATLLVNSSGQTIGFSQLSDIAVSPSSPSSPNGQLFGYGRNNGEAGLVKIVNLATGELMPIGSQTNDSLNALAFSPDGKLFGARGNSLFTVNTETGELTQVGQFGVANSAGDLVFFNGRLLLTTTTGFLFTLDTATGATTGSVQIDPTNTTIEGLAESGGRLLAFSGTSVFKLDPDTGALADLGSTNTTFQVFGAASAPTSNNVDPEPEPEPPVTPAAIPEPTTLAVFGVMAAVGFGYRRRIARD